LNATALTQTDGLRQSTAVIGFDIYFIGGCDDRNNGRRMGYCFNAVTKTWREIASMNKDRSFPSVAVLGDVLYVMGGRDYSKAKTAERWSPIADTTVRPAGASAAAPNDKVCIAGGYCLYGGPLRSAQVYVPRTNRWTLSDMRIGRYGLSCIAFHGCVYAIGTKRH
jgi:kelch-like protein 10